VGWPQLYVGTAGGNGALFLLYALIPYLGGREGGGFAAGLLTFAFMAASLPAQLAVPALSRVISERALLGAGLVLLGVPALAYIPGTSVAAMATITVFRGMGFGLFTVVSATVFTAKAGSAQRGRTAGRYGSIAATMSILLPSAGLWLYSSFGRAPVFLVACLVPLLALWSLTGSWRLPATNLPGSVSIRQGLGLADIVPLLTIFFVGAALSGVYSFLPFRTGRSEASWLLISFGVAFAVSRTIFGAAIDRRAVKVMIVASALVAVGATGIACSSWLGFSVPSSLAMGGGLGGLSTATLVFMVDAGRARRVVGAALWNFSYNVGSAIGGVALGATVSHLSTSGPFFVLICPFTLLVVLGMVRGSQPRSHAEIDRKVRDCGEGT
jgi:MFS family permease